MLSNKFFPYSSMQEINLDWILTKIKNILRFVPDDGAVGQILRRTAHGAEWSDEQGGGGAVSSVNGQTGAVVLTASDVSALPDTYVAPVDSVNGQTGTVVLSIPSDTADLTNTAGFVNAAGAAAAAPVQSVNGQTGAVSLAIPDSTSDLVNDSGFITAAQAPVQSVNGQTGATVLDASDVGAIPDDYYDNPVTGTITQLQGGGTFDQVACVKFGNLVIACARFYGGSASPYNYDGIFQMPVGFRPSVDVACSGYVFYDGVSQYALAKVKTNGEVGFNFASTPQSQMGFMAVYPI